MRKLNITPYKTEKCIDYPIKDAFSSLLFHPNLGLTMKDVIPQGELDKKIHDAEEYVLLEEEEYRRVLRAFESFKGFSKDDIELVKRVQNASPIEISQIKEI